MSKPHPRIWFSVLATAVLSVFITILVVVGLVAHTRLSGRTGLDMATLQLMRTQNHPHSVPLP